MIEIALLILLLVLSLILIRLNFLSSVFLALVLSTFIHKELFSIYVWDMMPIRVLLLAFLLNSSFEFLKYNGFGFKFLNDLKDPFLLLISLFILSKFLSLPFSKDYESSFFLAIF